MRGGMRTPTLALLALGTLLACGAPSATGTGDNPPPNPKWYVCKYETTPGEGERLQTGQNPISVSENAFPAGVTPAIGVEFNDAQGRSLIIAEDVGQPEPPTRDDCPPPNPPPTTTTTENPCPDPPCVPGTVIITTTTTTIAATTTSSSTSVVPSTTSSPPSSTSTTSPGPTTTTPPPPFTFGAAATVCVAEVPTIRIVFQNTFPALAGLTGTLTMRDINGNVISSQPLVYAPGTSVDLLYPGTSVNPDGSIDDVPGWILTDDGFWIRDPSDEFLRDGISLTYTVNPTATAFITYPPESSTCASPDGPFPPARPPVTPPRLPPTL